jgi:putative peptidoglycan lipid II flippase
MRIFSPITHAPFLHTTHRSRRRKELTNRAECSTGKHVVDDERVEAPRASAVGAAAVLLAASVLLSRVLGYAREALLAYRAGAGAATDAYYAAFQIPDLLNHLLAGGALSIAFVPLYTRQHARGDAAGAERLFATVLGTLGALALLATAVIWWFAEPLIALQFPRFDPATRALTVRLTRIVLPAQCFFITGGILNAALLARGRFGPSATAPLLYNAGIIAGGLFLAPHLDDPVEGFSWGALGGALAGPFLAPLLAARGGVPIRLRIAPGDRAFLGYLCVAAPLLLGQSLLTVDEWYQRWFGALLGAGAVAHLGYGRRLMLVPVAVVGQAIAAAALPALSRLWAEGKRAELNQLVLRTLQAGLALAVLAGAGCLVLAQPLVRLVYEHGAFTVHDTQVVAEILALLCLSAPAWVVQQIAVRAFYARGDTWRPMLLGTAVSLAVIPLYLALGRSYGVNGLAAAGAIGMSANALATLLLARRLHGAPELTLLAGTLIRAAAIALVASASAVVLYVSQRPGTAGALLDLVVGGGLFTVIAVTGVWVGGDAAMRATLAAAVRRLRRTP